MSKENESGLRPSPSRRALLGLATLIAAAALLVDLVVYSPGPVDWAPARYLPLMVLQSVAPLLGVVILGGVIDRFYQSGGLRRFRVPAVLAPAIVFTLFILASLALHPPTASNRLLDTTGVALPASVHDLRTRFCGHLHLAFSRAFTCDLYEFRCSGEDSRRLIRDLKLESAPAADAAELCFEDKRAGIRLTTDASGERVRLVVARD